MIYTNFIQGSTQWHAARCGKFTGTSACDMMKESEAFKTLLNEVKAERLAGISQDVIDSKVYEYVTGYETKNQPINLSYGKMMEQEAREALEEHTGLFLEEVGFVTHELYPYLFGSSPDGLDFQKCVGVEIKCPVTLVAHYKVLSVMSASDLKSYNPKYYWQCLFNMICTGFDTWVFASYLPFVEDKLFTFTLLRQECENDYNSMIKRMEYINTLINK